MTRKERSNGHNTETPDVSHIRNVEVTHEPSDVSVVGVMRFVLVLAVSLVAVSVAMWFLFWFFDKQQAKEPGPGPMALTQQERLPPNPRLQAAPGFEVELENGQKINLGKAAPQTEYRVLRQQWEENLKTGLKDQSGNIVGIPIDAAMDKVVSGEGLPSRMKGPAGKLQDYAISMPTAPSSGREVEKRLQ
jgi:hypothetical protein